MEDIQCREHWHMFYQEIVHVCYVIQQSAISSYIIVVLITIWLGALSKRQQHRLHVCENNWIRGRRIDKTQTNKEVVEHEEHQR